MKIRLRYRCDLKACAIEHPTAVTTFALPCTREDLRTVVHNEVRIFVRATGRDDPHAELVVSPTEVRDFERIEAGIILAMDCSAADYLGVRRVVVERSVMPTE